MPADLIDAILAAARSDAGLRAAVGGRAFRATPAAPPRLPYLLVRPIGDPIGSHTFGGKSTERGRVQFSVFAATERSADAGLAAVRARFAAIGPGGSVRAKLAYAGGEEIVAVPAGSARTEELATGRGAGARVLWHATQDYLFTTGGG